MQSKLNKYPQKETIFHTPQSLEMWAKYRSIDRRKSSVQKNSSSNLNDILMFEKGENAANRYVKNEKLKNLKG